MHWIYLIHEFHNLSWITEINELFHDILIYWDPPVYIYIYVCNYTFVMMNLRFSTFNILALNVMSNRAKKLPVTNSIFDHFHKKLISFGNIRKFGFICCLMIDDCVNLHMHLLTYAVACFCFFFTLFWSRDSVVFQKMCNSASYHITVQTWKAGKFCQCRGSVVHKWQKTHHIQCS